MRTFLCNKIYLHLPGTIIARRKRFFRGKIFWYLVWGGVVVTLGSMDWLMVYPFFWGGGGCTRYPPPKKNTNLELCFHSKTVLLVNILSSPFPYPSIHNSVLYYSLSPHLQVLFKVMFYFFQIKSNLIFSFLTLLIKKL